MILFIDDEIRKMSSYVDELEDYGYQVEFQSNVDSALDFFAKNKEQIELLILDSMMPMGEHFSDDDTEFGLRTGICLYKKIRDEDPTLPIIIFTHVSEQTLADEINSDPNALFLEKVKVFPYKLREKVEQQLKPETTKAKR